MRRREFIASLVAPAASPIVARAQQPHVPIIGFLVAGAPSSHGAFVAAFVQRLRELGWIEGRTVAIEYRWAEGRHERAAEIAAEFVRLKVDLIATSGIPATRAAKQATSAIPIVFAALSDPVGAGLVANLARPGGNLSGLSLQYSDLAGKRFQLLREALPGLRRLGILATTDNPGPMLEVTEVRATARTLGFEIVAPDVRGRQDFAPAFDTLKGRVDAIYVVTDPLTNTHRVEINALALAASLPTVHGAREQVEAGGLMTYGPSLPDLYRRAADYADKILRGAKPNDLPVEQPTKFELVINLRTAKALGLTVPESVLLQADEVIE
jgi:putative tryptophan/tyrosine transport system substrate-binding protein